MNKPEKNGKINLPVWAATQVINTVNNFVGNFLKRTPS